MIPLSIPNIGEQEQKLVSEVLAAAWVSSAGPEVGDIEDKAAEAVGVRFGVATNSGTSALHLALRVLDVRAGDLVVLPNLSFVAAAHAITYLGAAPILVDAEANGWQMDLDLLANFLENETTEHDRGRLHIESGRVVRAILAVHILGHACDPERLAALGMQYGLKVVEDAAEALGSTWNGQPLGSFGDVGVLSFNGNKIVTSGGGGMLLTNDPSLSLRARHLSMQAKRHPEEFLHDDLGYNYRMPNLNAALGLAQLGRLPEFLKRKREVFAHYEAAFADLDEVQLCTYDQAQSKPNHWLFTLRSPRARQLEEVLFIQKIETRKLWIPLDRLPLFQEATLVGKDNIAFQIYEESLSLPCSTGITDAELETVSSAVRKFFGKG